MLPINKIIRARWSVISIEGASVAGRGDRKKGKREEEAGHYIKRQMEN